MQEDGWFHQGQDEGRTFSAKEEEADEVEEISRNGDGGPHAGTWWYDRFGGAAYHTHLFAGEGKGGGLFYQRYQLSGLVKVYDALHFNAEGKTGIKISTGEPPKSNYLRPELLKGIVDKTHGTIVGTIRPTAAPGRSPHPTGM